MTSGHRILRCKSRRLTAPVMLFGLSSRSPRPKAIAFIAVLQRDTSRAEFGSSSPTCPATQSSQTGGPQKKNSLQRAPLGAGEAGASAFSGEAGPAETGRSGGSVRPNGIPARGDGALLERTRTIRIGYGLIASTRFRLGAHDAGARCRHGRQRLGSRGFQLRMARNSVGLRGLAGVNSHDCGADRHSGQDRNNSNAQLPPSSRCRAQVAELRVNILRGRHYELLMPAPAFSAAYVNSSVRAAASCCRSDWS